MEKKHSFLKLAFIHSSHLLNTPFPNGIISIAAHKSKSIVIKASPIDTGALIDTLLSDQPLDRS